MAWILWDVQLVVMLAATPDILSDICAGINPAVNIVRPPPARGRRLAERGRLGAP
jgi:hypothetical protein